MGGDKEDHATGQQDGAEDEGNETLPAEALPAQAAGVLLLLFPGMDAGCVLRIQDAGRLPAV
jgi:hypothetical protein